MELNSSNLVDVSTLQNKDFKNIKTDNLEDKELREVANSFESFFLNQIMDVSLKSTKIAGEGPGSDIIKGMYLQNIADSSAGTFGISDMLYEFLSKNNK
ncbi:rod-binding protein [Poseidonibacter lekithochrous]|uniref:rod-binding protein n=1 Tax=Poseidonibacter TaxID=2321187 RepID=UPI001C08802E|nr:MULTISPECIES: rod-binding protein [Poseidonibacter]MBU3015513.1 rod-binding protein [Poseidonibacter lekithochrous]MDO6828812.1 rod-binding protein [Poseidonibacter sp. 1_MG-2023]